MAGPTSAGGNRLVAVGLLVLTYCGVYWHWYPESEKVPLLETPLVLPYIETPLHFALVGAAVGIALVIVGFWRGW